MKNKIIELLSQNIPDIDKEELVNLLEIPPKPDMGDYAFPCFRLAKTLRKAPPLIASEIASNIRAC